MKWRNLVAPFAALLLGIAIGFVARGGTKNKVDKKAFVERREGGYKYINPLLECDIADDVLRNQELRPFKDKIEAYLNTRMDKRWASSVSVYFRELNDGLWFSIGDTERFVPASLRKIPLMIALLKQAEKGKGNGLLDRMVKFDLSRDYNADQNIKPSQTMVPGRGYAVRDLIYRMIVYSDNNAFTLLTKVVDSAEFDNVYAILRMQNPRATKDDDFLSVQTYASFFRVLYNATYLGREASDWALDILAKSEFKAGIVAGVPPIVTVSHKFGEHSDANAGTVQLHDCGIVYYPRHPYLVCVMSKGPNFEFLDDVIVEVSQRIFAEVDASRLQH
ncbi:MAG TPA: serine hydrolase [Geobacteraceae bacterium]